MTAPPPADRDPAADGTGTAADSLALALAEAALERYLAGCAERVPAFARRRLGLVGSLLLHRHAAGWDVVKAPINILLGIVNLVCELLGRLAARAGLRRLGAWLRARHWVLPTAVMRRLDELLRVELLRWPLHEDGRPTGSDGLTEALLLKQEAEAMGFKIMTGCMLGTSLAMAPAMLVAEGAAFVDLDGPLLLAEDRANAIRFEGSVMHPADPVLWG